MNANWAARTCIAAAPIGAALLLGNLIASDVLSFGGGDKELLIAAVLGAWGLLFAMAMIGAGFMRHGLMRSAVEAGAVATALILAAGLWLRLVGH